MDPDTTNRTHDAGHARKHNSLTLDQAGLKRWLITEVDLTVPRWAIVAVGFVMLLLLLIAVD